MEDFADLSVVIPYFNPGSALLSHITDLVKILDDSGMKYEIIAVSDGSTDGSKESIEGLFPEVLRNIVLPRNF